MRKAVADIVVARILEATQVRLSTILSKLLRDLGAETVNNEFTCFQLISKAARDAEILWVQAMIPGMGHRLSVTLAAEGRKLLSDLTEQWEREAEIQVFPLGEPCLGAQSVIGIPLPNMRGRLFLGITSRTLENELELKVSPWRDFLTQFGMAADQAFSRIEMRETDRMATHLELESFRAIVLSLWFHELGNFAAALQGSADLADRLLGKSMVEECREEVHGIKELAGKFRDVAAAINKPLEFRDKRKTFPLIEAAVLVQENYGALLKTKNIQLNITIPEELSVNLYFPLAYLALANLVVNSLQAIGNNGLIDIEAVLEHERVVCQVSDNGPGVALEKVEMLFVRGHSEKQGGSGYGLVGCRSALQKYGGDVRYDDSYQGGARFIVQFPIETRTLEEETS